MYDVFMFSPARILAAGQDRPYERSVCDSNPHGRANQ